MKLRIYLDTSVISLASDDRSPERRDLTLSFFNRAGQLHLYTSEVARQEVLDTSVEARRTAILPWLSRFEVIPVTPSMISLAERLIAAGIFTRGMEDDALHVAAASLSEADVLVSWNFRHLVNRRRRALVTSLFALDGLRVVEILSPSEV